MEAPDGLPVPRRYWAVLTVWLALAMSVLDGAIANVSLPTIARELGVSPASSIWVVNAYQLAITVCLLPLAALGDKLGHRRVYLVGLTLFVLGSLCCALSGTLPALVGARVLQGLGAAGIMSMNGALLRFTWPRSQLGLGLGLNAVVISVSAATGPTVSSLVLSTASWEWLFAINLPIGLLALALAPGSLPHTPRDDAPFDWISALLSALALGGLIFGAESLAREGGALARVCLALGLVAGVALVRRELGAPRPLVPFDLLRVPLFGLSIATSVVTFGAQMLAYTSLPFYFQSVLGRGAVETGLLMTPWPLAVSVAAPVAGRLADRYPAGLLGGMGLAVLAVGLLLLSRLGGEASDLDVAWRMVVCGLGFGFFQSPNNRALVLSSPLERSGAASGLLATARLLGQTSGAVATAVFFHAAGASATGVALGTASAVAAIAAVVSLARLRVPPAG